MRNKLIAAAAAAILLGSALPASADAAVVDFSGSRFNIDAPGPAAPRCGARTTINIRQSANSVSTGTSNFGSFVPTLSHCIQLPLPAAFDLGEFLFEFASGDTLFGTYFGALTAAGAGVFNVSQEHTILGGTGMFAGATGSFLSSGTLTFGSGPPQVQQSFRGTINAPAIPEPATWLMMLGGFGLIGAALRRRSPALAFAGASPR
jgi:hypothetical protein